MIFTNYLKAQLTDFVDSYRKYFWRTLGAVFSYTVICLVLMAFLLKFSNFDVAAGKRQVSLLSYFFIRYSAKETYSLVDSSKSVFIFFVSLFSIGLLRLSLKETDEENELSFKFFIKKIRGFDMLSLLGVLILSSVIDFFLFRLETISETAIENYELRKWVQSSLFILRIYAPLILFSLSIYKRTFVKPLKLSFKKIIFLFVSLWLFNEFAYEVSLFVRAHIFPLILAPFDEDKKYLYESFLGIPLIAFYFVGYHSAMTSSLRQLNEQ